MNTIRAKITRRWKLYRYDHGDVCENGVWYSPCTRLFCPRNEYEKYKDLAISYKSFHFEACADIEVSND